MARCRANQFDCLVGCEGRSHQRGARLHAAARRWERTAVERAGGGRAHVADRAVVRVVRILAAASRDESLFALLRSTPPIWERNQLHRQSSQGVCTPWSAHRHAGRVPPHRRDPLQLRQRRVASHRHADNADQALHWLRGWDRAEEDGNTRTPLDSSRQQSAAPR
eukprot:SAG11_NODE_4320_length_1949_cov_1.627027_1_plen_165_part_00